MHGVMFGMLLLLSGCSAQRGSVNPGGSTSPAGSANDVVLRSETGHAKEDAEVLERRLKRFGIQVGGIEVRSESELLLRLGSPQDVKSVVERVLPPTRLDFLLCAENQAPVRPRGSRTLEVEGVQVDEDDQYVASSDAAFQALVQKLGGSSDPYVVLGVCKASGECSPLLLEKEPAWPDVRVSKAEASVDTFFNEPQVQLSVEPARLEALTQNLGRCLAMLIDGKVQSAPRISETVDHGQLRLTPALDPRPVEQQLEDAKGLAVRLETGPLRGAWKVVGLP